MALMRAAALFDLDGTLVDTADDLGASMNAALAAVGCAPVDPGLARSLIGQGARRMLMRGFALSTGRDAAKAEIDAGFEAFLRHYEANIAVHSRPFDGVVPLIDALKADGWSVAVCTNKRERFARLLLKELKMLDLFDSVVGADTAAAPKPDPAPVLYCLDQTGAERGVFFGDSDTDIRAATAARTPCIIVDFGYGPLTLKKDAYAVISHYGEAMTMVKNDFWS